MRYELFLALRYLNGLRRSGAFVSMIAAISVVGIALGVAALLVVLGVMSGFDADLQERIVGANPHLVVDLEGHTADVNALIDKITDVDGIAAAAPFVQTQVLLRSKEQATGVILRGIDPELEAGVTGLSEAVQEGQWPPGHDELILGSELGKRLGVRPGENITVIGGEKGTKQMMTVKGFFTTGMYEYDSNLVLTSVETVQSFLGWNDGRVSGIGVRLEQPMAAAQKKYELQKQLGYPYWILSWMDMNKNLFSALKLEKLVMFLILTLIVLVACFNVIATLLMMVGQKTKEIGILKSIGASRVSIRRIFTRAGLLIGLIGTVLGTAIGLGLCSALKKYQFVRLPAEVYYIDHLPVKLQLSDILLVVGAALLMSWAASLYPSRVASGLQPAEAVRYE